MKLLKKDVASPLGGVADDIAGDFGDGRRDPALVDHPEPELAGEGASHLPRLDDPVLAADDDHLRVRGCRVLTHHMPPICRRSKANPLSAVSAVRTPRNARPSSTSVMATAGWIPTTTVSAPI